MADGTMPDRGIDDLVDLICEALWAAYGERAILVAERQMGAASDDALATWLAIVARLKG